MKCPSCGGDDLAVKDSRQTDDEVRRRRTCTACGVRYATVERIVDVYTPAPPGRPAGEPKPVRVKKEKQVSIKAEKRASVRRTEARRKVEDMMDEREDYSMYDDLADVGHLWK